MDNYTIIEDIFGEEPRNQVTSARGFVGQHHIPNELRNQSRQQPNRIGKVNERPEIEFQSSFNRQPPMMDNVPPHLLPRPPVFQNAMNETMNQDLPRQMMNDNDFLLCKDVFNHVENCPICNNYFKKDVKFYWLIIGILVIIILLLTRNSK